MPRLFRGTFPASLVLAAAPAAVGAPAPPAPVEWIVEDGTTLTLRVVLEERGTPCGGELIVDPNRRELRFEGVPGEIGCKRFVIAAFEDVEDLHAQRRKAGFVLEVGGEMKDRLVLLPLPHFRWFTAQHRVRQGGFDRQLASLGIIDRDGDLMRTGSPVAARLERVDLPPEVVADTQKAVELIREAMGRPPAPAEILWEALYGRPVDTTVAELLEAPGNFANQPVRLRARLLAGGSKQASLRLEDEGATIPLVPEHGAEVRFAAAGANFAGQEVEIVGRLRRRGAGDGSAKTRDGAAGGRARGELYVSGWQCAGPETMAAVEGKAATLEELFARPGDFAGEVLRVVGCFRGRNAFGDLPGRSQRSPLHWILKSDRYAIWVTGHEPAGKGWALDLASPSNSEWLEVVGRLRWRKGFGYLNADRVHLVPRPSGARVQPARRVVSSTPTAPPEIIFTLPLEYELLESRSRIILQFDRSMDEQSFTDRVRLRYVGSGPGLDDIAIHLAYDEFRRALIISPVRPLVSGRRVEVLLLPGIVDIESAPLGPRSGVPVSSGFVDVVAYDIGGSY